MAFAENINEFLTDFAVDAMLSSQQVRGIPSGETIDPLTGILVAAAPSFIGSVDDLGIAQVGDTLIISTGPFAGTYRVAEPQMLDTVRAVVTLKLERVG